MAFNSKFKILKNIVMLLTGVFTFSISNAFTPISINHITLKPKPITAIKTKAKTNIKPICLIPGYKAQYENFYNGSDLGVSTRIAEKQGQDKYKITYKLSIHKFIFSKTLHRTSEGKINSDGIVMPNKFKVIDEKADNPDIFSIHNNELDPLSYITQARISILQKDGIIITNLTEESLLGEKIVYLHSNNKIYKEKINGKNFDVIKVSYQEHFTKPKSKSQKGSYGILWLDKNKAYLPVQTVLHSTKDGKQNLLIEKLVGYNPNIKQYGCLYESNKQHSLSTKKLK